MNWPTLAAAPLALLLAVLTAADDPVKPLAEPVLDGKWLRPAAKSPAQPVWGIKDGIAIGLWPTGGPRGLFRIYAPYLDQQRPQMVNFISVEPVVKEVRGQSELEVGWQSKRRGLAMWTADTRQAVAEMREPTAPARGRIEKIDGAESLTFFVATEPFRNEARPVIQVILRADRPREVAFRVFAAEGSAAMDSCVLSATMGNYGRLRRLWLNGEVADARKVWPSFTPDRLGFAPWREWDRDRLLKIDGDLLVAATSDEADPAGAEYDPKVRRSWRYRGKPATHTWRTKDVKGVETRVNGRDTYWGNGGPIPGGIAYENFELEVPFAAGQEFRFGVTTDTPEKLGFDAAWGKRITDGK